MGKMKDDEWIVGLGFLALCIFLILVVTPLVLVVLAIVASIRYEQLVKSGQEVYDRIEMEQGVDLPIDDVLRALFGAGVELPQDGFEEPIDWFTATLFGVEEEQ
jgi:hypothetical protein